MTLDIFPPPPTYPLATTEPVELKLPPNETRPHRYFTLPNGLQAIVVSDPTTDKAAACVSLGVGFMEDPDDLPGCAHFVEHLMCTSSKNFPGEGAYMTYIYDHSGNLNAGTSFNRTVYHFEVASDALKGALDRLADLYINPLFTPGLAERETHAVDLEFKGNAFTHDSRLCEVQSTLAKNHPFGKFGIGNHKTLWTDPVAAGRNPRDEIASWWEKQYCPRRTAVSVVGREDIDTLAAWISRLFGGMAVATDGLELRGRNGVHIVYDSEPYGPDEQGLAVFVKPIKDECELELQFIVPDVAHLHEVKPFQVVLSLLEASGKGSLKAYLKKQGWALGVQQTFNDKIRGFNVVTITIKDLTASGLAAWREVVTAVYAYLDVIRDGLDGVSTYFDELRALANLSFRFAEPKRARRYAAEASSWMLMPVPRADILSWELLYGEYDEQIVRLALDHLDPARVIVFITSKTLPDDIGGDFDQVEPYYGAEYLRVKLNRDLLSGPFKVIPELALPKPNPFIPTQFDLPKAGSATQQAVTLVAHSELSAVWHKGDQRFLLPKSKVYIKLKSPLISGSLRQLVLTEVLIELWRYEVDEEVYQAKAAGSNVELEVKGNIVVLSIQGYTEKLPFLAVTLLSKLTSLKAESDGAFKVVVDQLRLKWKNAALDRPFVQTPRDLYPYLVTEGTWRKQELLDELDYVTLSDVHAFRQQLLECLHIEALAHGSITREASVDLDISIRRVLGSRPLSPAERSAVPLTLAVPQGSEMVWQVPLPQQADAVSLVFYNLTFGATSAEPTTRALALLLGQIAKMPAFNELRTKEQLGYVAMTVVRTAEPLVRLGFLVETTHHPVHVENRIENFLDTTLLGIIEGLSPEAFTQTVTSARERVLETPKTLEEETERDWDRITAAVYDFDRREVDVENLSKITKDQLVAFYKDAVHTSSATRRKLSIHLCCQSPPPSDAVLRPETKLIDDIVAFKLGLPRVTVAVTLDSVARARELENVQDGL